MNRHELVSFKKHEVRVQELRNERKSEGLRLAGLKKALQARLISDVKRPKALQAA
jgi:hypothetical protein